jgi:hypothetical protein
MATPKHAAAELQIVLFGTTWRECPVGRILRQNGYLRTHPRPGSVTERDRMVSQACRPIADSDRVAGRVVGRAKQARPANSARPRPADAWLAVPRSDRVILGVCLARLVCWVDRGQAAGDGRYPGPQFGGLEDLDVGAEPQELGLGVLG